MTRLYNRSEMKDRRRELRQNATTAEEALWSFVRREQRLGVKFKRQYSVGAFVLDFYAPSVKLAIELDGSSHDVVFGPGKDAARQKMIEDLDITFLRFRNEEVFQSMDHVLRRIDEMIVKLQGTTSPLTPLLGKERGTENEPFLSEERGTENEPFLSEEREPSRTDVSPSPLQGEGLGRGSPSPYQGEGSGER